MTARSAAADATTYRILMVCTGNVCRSPVMERLFVARLRQHLPADQAARFRVESAGTGALVGEPMMPPAAQPLTRLGGDPNGFLARQLDRSMIDADLVLTATREHRGQVVTEVPRAAARTLTLRELVRLLQPVSAEDITTVAGDDPVARMRAIAAAAFGNRGRVPLADPADDDIADPYRRAQDDYDQAAAQIDAALDVLFALLAPSRANQAF